MSVEIPSALIRQIQAKLRKNAGVPSSYDPRDHSLRSSLPNLDDAISDLDDDDDDPSHLRCCRCLRGSGLLRGPRSTLCIFCGHDRRRDGVVQSISFNSTAACKKLLQSVQLDGSEVVNLNTEPNDSNRRQDTQHDELVLSTVLDLELKWPTGKEDEYAVDRSFDKAHISVQDVNLSGVDLDTFFYDSKNTTVSGAPGVISEELMPGKHTISTESIVSSGPENFGSFKDFQTSNMAVKLEENNKGGGDFSDSFAEWDDGFQSASYQAFHRESESVDHHLGSSNARPAISATDVAVAAVSTSVDLFKSSATEFSTQVTPTSTIDELSNIKHEIRNKVNSGEPTNECSRLSGSADWIQDDFWPSTADQLKTTKNTNDNERKDDVQCMTSADVSWGEDEMRSTSNTHASDIKSRHHDDDVNALDNALDSWQDFASSKEARGVSSSFWIQSGNDIDGNASTLKSVDIQDIDFGNFVHPEPFSGGLAEQGGPNKVNDIQLNNSSSTNNIAECLSVKSMHEIHDGVAAFDDPLDSSQDIIRSKEAPEVSSVTWIQWGNEIVSNEHASTLQSVDAPAMEPRNFSQLDSFLGAAGEQGGHKKVNGTLLDTSGSTSNINEILVVKNSNDNSSEAWQDISSSDRAAGDLSNVWSQPITWSTLNEVASTKSLETHNMEFGSFLYSGSLSAALGGHQDPREMNASELDPEVSSTSTNEFDITNQNDDNDDSLDDWQDFTSSKGLAGVLPDTSGAEGTSRDYIPGGKHVDPHDLAFDGFLHSGSLPGALGGQQDPIDASARKLDPPVSTTSTNEFDITKQNDDNDYPQDNWQDFTSSKESAGDLPNTSEGTSRDHIPGVKPADPQDSELDGFLHSGSLSGSFGGQQDSREVSAKELDLPVSSSTTYGFDLTKQNDDNDDSLDNWQDFTSSKESAGELPNSSGAEGTSRDHIAGSKPADPQCSEFDGFLYSGSLSGELGGQKDPRMANARKFDYPVSSTSLSEFNTTKQNDNNDDSLADWQDFSSSKEAPGVLPNTSGAKATLRDHAAGVKPVDPYDSEFGSFVYLDSFSGMVGKKGFSHVNDIRLDTSVSNTSKSSNSMNQNDGFFGSWKDFSSLNEVSQNLSNLPMQTITNEASDEHTMELKSGDLGDMEFGDFLQSDVFSGASHQEDSIKATEVQLDTFVSTSSTKESNNTKNVDDNDPFDAWQDFIGSNNSQRRSTNLLEEPNTRVTSYRHLSGTKSLDLHDMEFGDFLHSGFLSGALGGKRSSTGE